MLASSLLVGLLCVNGVPTSSDSDVRHEVGEGSERRNPSSLESIQRQLDNVDRRIGNRRAERFAVWDLAVAGSQAEHDDIGQGVLILIVALAQSESDLPLRRVYVVGPKGDPLDLVPVGTLPRDVLQTLNISGKGGRNVWAGLYFLPIARRLWRGNLIADFVTRPGFELGKMPSGVFGGLEDKPGKVEVRLGNVAHMASREFPGVKLNSDLTGSIGPPQIIGNDRRGTQ